MEFDRFTLVLLVRNPDAPAVDEEAAGALQDAHLAHLADLHEAGHVLAAGPFLDGEELRGVMLFGVGSEQALALAGVDPAVQAGLLLLRAMDWQVPAGAVHFTPTRFPRSVAEAIGTD